MAADERPEKPTIQCAANGPYLVQNLAALKSSSGDALPTQPTTALCRCGGSNNKPLCDGSHARIGFSEEKLDDRVADRRDVFPGKDITIYDNRGICCHAGSCTSGCPEVWRMKTEPWIDADGAAIDAIIETIEQCPSGALSYAIDGVEHRDQQRDPAIHVSKDGPYLVEGGVELQNVEQGDGASTEHYALCRCGASKNKPFCDGTHWYIEFKDDGSASNT